LRRTPLTPSISLTSRRHPDVKGESKLQRLIFGVNSTEFR
jgi:hypothetical protein